MKNLRDRCLLRNKEIRKKSEEGTLLFHYRRCSADSKRKIQELAKHEAPIWVWGTAVDEMLINEGLNFDEIMERLKIASNTKSYKALADMLELSSYALTSLKKQSCLPYDKINVLANSLNVNMDWILTGEGEMLKAEAP
jgi:hypothetical protein